MTHTLFESAQQGTPNRQSLIPTHHMTVDLKKEAAYDQKSVCYFAGARTDFVDRLPANPNGKLLEIGSGNGDTSQYALETKKCGECYGVEISKSAAALARERGHHVVVGDIEEDDLDFQDGFFDVLIMSEVLEHLVDPWAALKKLRPFLKKGAVVMAGSPNVCHHSVIRSLLGGGWQYHPSGVFDETHLRWFGLRDYRNLFEKSGYRVREVRPAFQIAGKAAVMNRLTFRKFEHLFHKQIFLEAVND